MKFHLVILSRAGSLLLTLIFALALVGCSKSGRLDTHPEATLADVNRAMARWQMANGQVPAEISDLTNSPTLKGRSLPNPPPGKKLAIDPVTRLVVFVDQ